MSQCMYCGKDISCRFWIVKRGGKDDLFCSERCANLAIETKYRYCSFCHEIIVGTPWFYPNGTFCCDSCHRDAVKDHKQLEENWEMVLDIFRDKFHYEPPCGVVSKFIDDDMNMEKNINYMDYLGYHSFTKCGCQHSICRIYICCGLPAEICQATMAHELAHDLMYHIWGDPNNKTITEGFAMYMESLYNIASGHDRRNLSIDAPRENSDPALDPYAAGYRMIYDIAAGKGYAGVMSFMREAAAKAKILGG